MKRILTFISLCMMLSMQSCTSDQDPTVPETKESDTAISHMVVKYGDRIYETDVIAEGDSVTYLNEEYAEIYRSKIAKTPDIAAIVSSDETGTCYVEYFPSEKRLLERYDFIRLEDKPCDFPAMATRGGVIDLMPPNNIYPVLAVAELYDDKNFKDTELITYATTMWATAIPKLKEIGFNDKASSIKVFNRMTPSTNYTIAYTDVNNKDDGTQHQSHFGSQLRPVLKCYHNSDFSGSVLYCIASPTGSTADHTDNNLKNIGWNDRISAVSWLLVYDFSLFSSKDGKDPEIPAHKDC